MISITMKGRGESEIPDTVWPKPTVKVGKSTTSIRYEDKPKDLSIIERDLKTIGVYSAPLMRILLDFGKGRATGRMVNRSREQLDRIGVVVEEIPWEKDGGLVLFNIRDGAMTGGDVYPLSYLLSGIAERAQTRLSYTHHSMHMYQIKEATGMVQRAKKGDIEALLVSEWVEWHLQEAIERELEVLKRRRAAAKAARAKITKAASTSTKVDELMGEDEGEGDRDLTPLSKRR